MNWKTIFAAGAIILFTGNLYAQTIRIAGIGANDGNNATDDVCASGDLDCTIARIDATTYYAMSVAELRANYDVLLFTWATEGALNADWTTRILPYLNLGGGVIFEDGSSPNIADLAPAIIGNVLELGSSNVIAVVPGFPTAGNVWEDKPNLDRSLSFWACKINFRNQPIPSRFTIIFPSA